MWRIIRFSAAVASVAGALFISAGAVKAQIFINPGETVEIGTGTDLETITSSCAGLNTCLAGGSRIERKIEAITAVSGIAESKSATAILTNEIQVSGNSDRAVEGQISGSVSWVGDLETFGFAGAKASVSISVDVVDIATGIVVGGQSVFSDACETFIAVDSCLKRPDGSAPVGFAVNLQRGRIYKLRFILECNSMSGAGDSNCIFNEGGAFPFAGGFAQRSVFTLSLEDDLIGLIVELQESVEILSAQLAEHDQDLDQHDAEMKALLDQHDAAIEALLDQHDADIKALLIDEDDD